MTYNNTTKSKFSYEVETSLTGENENLGDFATMKEANAAIAEANLPSDTLITIHKHTWSEQTPAYSSSIVKSVIHAEYETA